MNRRWMLAMVVVASLAGCASIVPVEGEYVVGERLVVQASPAWNRITSLQDKQPFESWTQHGFALDQLRLWSGLRSGQPLVAAPPAPAEGRRAPRVPTFRAGMAHDQLANLFEVLYAADGSQVQITRMDAASFVGERGLRLEFSVLRQRDDVQLSGVAWMAVRNDELFAVAYTAPRLAFFGRGRPMVEALVEGARVKGGGLGSFGF